MGREEIGAAAVVITLVDVVVFLPIAFIQGQVGRQIAEFAIVVVISTLTSLFVSFTITPTLAGLWALRSHWKPWRVVDWFGRKFDDTRSLVHAARAALEPRSRPARRALLRGRRSCLALALVGLGVVGEEFIPPVDRGEIFIQLIYPIGTPIQTVEQGTFGLEQKIAQYARHLRKHGGGRRVCGLVRRFRLAEQRRPSPRLAQRRPQALHRLLGRRSSSGIAQANLPPGVQAVVVPATSTARRQRAADRLSRHRRNRRRSDAVRPAGLAICCRKSRARRASTAPARSSRRRSRFEFDRNKAQALGVDLGQAAQAAGAAFGGNQAAQFETTAGLEQVQVIYPQSYQTSIDELKSVAIRSSSGRHRLLERHRALRVDADGAADHAYRPQERHSRQRELLRRTRRCRPSSMGCSSACRRCTFLRTSSCARRRSGSRTSCIRRSSAWAFR